MSQDEERTSFTPMGPDLAPEGVSEAFDRAFAVLHEGLPPEYQVFMMVYSDGGVTAAATDELTERIDYHFHLFVRMQRMSKQ